jgi:hypothetical protein
MGSTLKCQEFTSSGTFTVPAGVSGVWVTMIGGGGGGGSYLPTGTPPTPNGAGGGGAAEFVRNRLFHVSGGMTVTIGAGGTVTLGAATGGHGGITSFGTAQADGGWGGVESSQNPTHVPYHPELQPAVSGSNRGGDGGGCYDITGGGLPQLLGSGYMPGVISPYTETNGYQGGSSGGAGGVNFAGGPGGTAESVPGGPHGLGDPGSFDGGGGGGGASPWGTGGAGGAGDFNGHAAAGTAYGAGGGGAGGNRTLLNTVGGVGIGGYCVVFWCGP